MVKRPSPPPPPTPTRSERLQSSIAKNPLKTAMAVFVFIGALGGAIAAVPKIEPFAPAHRAYVREQVAEEKTMQILRDVQIEQAEGKRDATINDLAKWTLEYSKTHAGEI